MSLVVGVAVEGKDDFDVIEASVTAEFSVLGIPEPTFRRLQPEPDATGQIPTGGWSRVIGWLKQHSGHGIETYFAPLFSGEPACDLVVVHIDADICAQCLAHLNIPIPQTLVSVSDTVNALRSALDTVSALSADRRGRFAYAVPVFKTENWLMASVADCPDAKWRSPDAKVALRSLFDPTKFSSIKSMKSKFIENLSKDSSNVLDRAKSYQIFSDEIRLIPAMIGGQAT